MRSYPMNLGTDDEVLLIGAHCDDIEIGCGGMLQSLGALGNGPTVHCVVLGATEERQIESENALRSLFDDEARLNLEFLSFPNSYFPSNIADIKADV